MPPLKHVIDRTGSGVNLFTTTAIDLAIGTLNPDPISAGGEKLVRNGSIIRQMTLQLDVNDAQNTTGVNFYDWYIWFNVAGAQALADPAAVNPSLTKMQIFHQDGFMSSVGNMTSIGVVDHHVSSWRLVINIPRAYQQVNDGDKIQFVHKGGSNQAIMDYKLKVIYKEYYP